jgi:hypothetical protein
MVVSQQNVEGTNIKQLQYSSFTLKNVIKSFFKCSTKYESKESSNAAEDDRVPFKFDFHEYYAKGSAHHS